MGILVYLKSLLAKPESIDPSEFQPCAWNLTDLENDTPEHKEKYQELLREAARLMVARDYTNCIEAYQIASGEAKSDRHFCDIQIAQAYRLMGEPMKSLDFYWAACIHGADKDKIDDHVWHLLQSCSEKNDTDNYLLAQLLNRYLTRFPDGKHQAEAREWMKSLSATQNA
jgi:hypothetical protein